MRRLYIYPWYEGLLRAIIPSNCGSVFNLSADVEPIEIHLQTRSPNKQEIICRYVFDVSNCSDGLMLRKSGIEPFYVPFQLFAFDTSNPTTAHHLWSWNSFTHNVPAFIYDGVSNVSQITLVSVIGSFGRMGISDSVGPTVITVIRTSQPEKCLLLGPSIARVTSSCIWDMTHLPHSSLGLLVLHSQTKCTDPNYLPLSIEISSEEARPKRLFISVIDRCTDPHGGRRLFLIRSGFKVLIFPILPAFKSNSVPITPPKETNAASTLMYYAPDKKLLNCRMDGKNKEKRT
ncbi:hypothetical protein ACOME3_010260 [Neoechinorhynchus agilis]